MKKILLLIFACMLTTAIYAQSPADDDRYVYCELVGINKLLSTKLLVTVDMGQHVKLFSTKNQFLVDENNKLISFNSMVDAMNHMGAFGWDFVQSYIVQTSQTCERHWILKRDVALLSEEERAAMLENVNLNK